MGRRTLIVDDHADFRRMARAVLDAEDFCVVGEAADGEEALREVARLEPDIVLLDVQLPGTDGIEVATRLNAAGAAPTVVLISSRQARDYGARLAAAPVAGFLTKSQLSGEALAQIVDAPV
jgi:DNA-binding NarL/FixJ family response regulator